MPGTPILIGPRLELRPWKSDEIDTVFGILSDPVTMAFWPQPYNRAGAELWLARAMDQYKQGIGRMAVIRREDGAIIGDAGLMAQEFEGEPMLDIGWIIHHPYQRQGFGLEAGSLLLHYARHEVAHPNIMANMPDHHPGSFRIAEKLGMQLVATAPNPRNRDMLTRWYRA